MKNKFGMLWFDNEKNKSLETKIKEAANYYKNKYGPQPSICFINDKEEIPQIQGIKIEKSKSILPNHLWMGIP